MAISKNLLLKNLSGSLGKQLVIKQYRGKTVVTKHPDMSNRVLSKKQVRMNELMQEANYQAKYILADENRRRDAQLRLNVTSNRLYTALVKEYFQNNK